MPRKNIEGMNRNVRRKLETALLAADETHLAGYVAEHIGILPAEGRQKNVRIILSWLEEEEASVPTAADKLQLTEEFECDGLRVCSHCGRLIDRGYVLDDSYACDKRCALELYRSRGLKPSDLSRDLGRADDGGDCYYTEF